MNTGVEMAEALYYNLQIFGFIIDGYVNFSVITRQPTIIKSHQSLY